MAPPALSRVRVRQTRRGEKARQRAAAHPSSAATTPCRLAQRGAAFRTAPASTASARAGAVEARAGPKREGRRPPAARPSRQTRQSRARRLWARDQPRSAETPRSPEIAGEAAITPPIAPCSDTTAECAKLLCSPPARGGSSSRHAIDAYPCHSPSYHECWAGSSPPATPSTPIHELDPTDEGEEQTAPPPAVRRRGQIERPVIREHSALLLKRCVE